MSSSHRPFQPPIRLILTVTIALFALLAATTFAGDNTPVTFSATGFVSEDSENAINACTQNLHTARPKYRKDVILSTFARKEPTSSSAGMLHDVESGLPNLISLKLQRKYNIDTKGRLQYSAFATDIIGEQTTAQHAREITQQKQSQYLISGSVLEMSMRNWDTTYSPNLWQSVKNTAFDYFYLPKYFDSRDRHFSFSLDVREATTGEVVFKRNYHTTGVWKIRRPTDIGFRSARFWDTHYGKNIQKITDRASSDIAHAIHCQPYITHVDTRMGSREVKVLKGANSGLMAGDSLELFQVVVRPNNAYDSYNTHLINSHTHLTLQAVYPSHSIALAHNDTPLNGEYVAIVSPPTELQDEQEI